MESLVFVTLTPLAAALMLAVAVVAWRRRETPGGWGLVAFSAASAGWLIFDALSVIAPTHESTVRLAQVAFACSPLPGVAWLAFMLSYIDRFDRRVRAGVAALAVWCVLFGVLALLNDAHRLVWATWETLSDGPFLVIGYTLGPLAWIQTVFMWTITAVSLGIVLWVYARAGHRDRALSQWIVAGALVPLAVNVIHLVGFDPVEKDFTPVAMAVSSGAFALGLVRYQLLDLRPIARAALVDNLQEGVLVLDTHGRVVDANPALRQALGENGVEIGRLLRDTAPALAAAIDTTPDQTFRLDDGPGARYVDLRVSPLTDRAGASTGRLVLLHDVTRRRQERTALHQANADLYHANAELQAQNDELDAFSHTVAHDLKNSIHGVMGWAQILREDGPDLPAAKHSEIADEVVTAARKMGVVVHELLLLAGVRKAAIEPQPIRMEAVVEEAIARVRRTPVSPTLDVSRPDAWPSALGHDAWVEEIWVNYLSNAVKYGGPTITIGTDMTASGQARFWVHDDGPGLTPEEQAHLFIPFSRVGSLSVEGHGLGLSIVRRITERLGGTCGVESAPGRGTRFWFALPGTSDEACASLGAPVMSTA